MYKRQVLTVTNDDLVRVNMGEPNFEPSAVPFRANKAEKTYIMCAAEQTILCGVVSMGNPHCVIPVSYTHLWWHHQYRSKHVPRWRRSPAPGDKSLAGDAVQLVLRPCLFDNIAE